MATHTLTRTKLLPADLESAWRFFSDPRNLARITPRAVGFVMRTPEVTFGDGAIIDYTIKPLLGIPIGWRTLIDRVEEPHGFRDRQLSGPYRSWVHQHRFTAVRGGVRMDDTIDYEMPYGPLGELAHRWIVRTQLEHIFDVRAVAVANIFEPAGDPRKAVPGTVAVAGGTGFVGSEIVRELRRRGRRVIAISARGEVARGQIPDDVAIRTADVRHPEMLRAALQGVDELVIALAFPGSPVEQPRKGYTFLEVDARGTERLIEAGRRAGVRRVVYVSGAGASHEARRHWFRAKAIAEDAVRGSGMAWTILRPTWIYGPGDVSLNRFLSFARSLPFVPMTDLGRQRLAPVFVRDVAQLAADALVHGAAVDRTFEVGGPETMSMRDVLHRALSLAGLRRPLMPGPTPLIKLAAWPMRFLPDPPLSPAAVDFVNQPATVDVAPLLEAMPRTLTTLEDGLATYLGPRPSDALIVEPDHAELPRAA
jgi:NADH dehydrogenase